ncbi:MAG: L,D-transpeptidase family protein [Pseudolabrys sp.]
MPHLNRPFVRALLASVAVIAAAIVLAGCDPDSITPTGRSQAPLSEKMLAEIAAKNMDKDSPILARIFKEEAEMEIWKQNRDGEYALLKTYPICRWSGDLGPKKKQGDRQAPEGFYTITPGQMNPNSNYYLAFNTGYPNASDRAWGYTGSELMVHGDCSSRGCYAMTDEQIQEIYALARESFFGGQKSFQLEAFPFRMTALNMAKHRNNPNFAFWTMIKKGYDHFEATHREPKVAVCEKRYVFDAAAPKNASQALSFNARGKCPAYELDKNIADAVLDKQRHEQFQMAEYIARGVDVVPARNGVDGGMNPVFASKLTINNNGQVYLVAGNTMVPGALPRTPNPPATTAVTAQAPQTSQPVVMATVPMRQAAPQPKKDEAPQQQPTSIAGLFGNLISRSQAQSQPSAPATASELRGPNTEMAAKPKRAAPVRTASAPAVPHPKPLEAAPPTPDVVANNAPAPARAPPVQQARDGQKTPAPDLRSAYSSSPLPSDSGLLTGAQPVVPASSFESRWAAAR